MHGVGLDAEEDLGKVRQFGLVAEEPRHQDVGRVLPGSEQHGQVLAALVHRFQRLR